MIFLPFINALILYVFITDGQLFNNQYKWFVENIAVRFPVWVIKALGGRGCVLCPAFHMGLIQVICFILFLDSNLFFSFCIIFYNAVLTHILIKLMK